MSFAIAHKHGLSLHGTHGQGTRRRQRRGHAVSTVGKRLLWLLPLGVAVAFVVHAALMVPPNPTELFRPGIDWDGAPIAPQVELARLEVAP